MAWKEEEAKAAGALAVPAAVVGPVVAVRALEEVVEKEAGTSAAASTSFETPSIASNARFERFDDARPKFLHFDRDLYV